jgi:hypothetical protein
MWVYLIGGIYVEKIERDENFDGIVDRTISYGE